MPTPRTLPATLDYTSTPDAKTLARIVIAGQPLQTGYPRRSGPVTQPCAEILQLLWRAAGDAFNATVSKITHPTVYAELSRPFGAGLAKKYALHASADDKAVTLSGHGFFDSIFCRNG